MHVYEVLLNDITSLGSLVLYGVILLVSFILSAELGLSLLYGVVVLYAFVVPLRLLFFRNRPVEQVFSNWVEKIDSSSFPSLHGGRMGLLCSIFMGLEFFYLVVFVAVLVCVSRILLKKHHMSDILVGFALGLVIGLFV